MDSVVWILSLCCVVAMVNSLPIDQIVKICKDQCEKTDISCYAPVDGQCEKFIQCKKTDANNQWVGTMMPCAHGLFFDKLQRRCLRPETVNCDSDKCKIDPQLIAHGAENGNCRKYWSCHSNNIVGRYSSPGCCEENSTFVNGRCDSTVHCNSSCFEDKKNDTGCQLIRVIDNPRQYKNGDGPTSQVQACPGTMVFDEESCGCIQNELPNTNRNCKADIDVEYSNSGFVKKNINWVGSTALKSKTVVDGIEYTGKFTGKHYMQIPLYDGVNLKTIAGRILFYPSANKNKQILLSNCIPRINNGSFVFELNPTGSTLTIRGYTHEQNNFKMAIKYKEKAWNTLHFMFKDSALKAQIIVAGQVLDSKEISGIQESIQEIGPFRIGMCSNDGLYGYIKEVQTYKCDPGTLFQNPAPAL